MDRSPSAFMKSFFAEVAGLDELEPDAIATKYINYCYDRFHELASLVKQSQSSSIFLVEDKSLSFATKRSLLVSEATVMSHMSGTIHQLNKQCFGVIGPPAV
jgi:hypothetical protein